MTLSTYIVYNAANMITYPVFVIVVEMFQNGGTQDEW